MKNILYTMQSVIRRAIDSFTVMTLRKIAGGDVA